MSAHFKGGVSAAIMIFASAGIARADVTAQQVWDDFRAYLSAGGYGVTASESMSGGTLTITDLAMSMDLPEDEGEMTITVGELTFTETGDGSVRMGLPASMPITIAGTGSDGESFSAALDYTQSGFDMIASGTPEAMSYAYSADTIGVELESITVDGQTMAPEDARMTVTMNDIDGTTQMRAGELRTYDQSGTAASVSYDMAFADPESEGRFTLSGDTNGLAFSGEATLPETMDPENMNAMLNAGFSASGRIEAQGGSTNLAATGDGEDFMMESTSRGGTIVIGLDDEQLLYTVDQRGVDITARTAELPFPITAAFTELGFKFMIPTQSSEEAQDFAVTLTLGDFTMSDMIWGIFDPAGQLPRDPATIAMDISGTLNVLVDYFDPEVAETLEETGGTPVEVNSLALNDLRVSAVGVDLTGSGAFTFDNSDMETFDGIPAPDGSVDLKLVGGNAFIDKMVAMGFLPEDQAMGARMMMGLFAVPGSAPDTLTSKIEVSPDGQIKANGQRIQ
jgi:hypothetical protein